MREFSRTYFVLKRSTTVVSVALNCLLYMALSYGLHQVVLTVRMLART